MVEVLNAKVNEAWLSKKENGDVKVGISFKLSKGMFLREFTLFELASLFDIFEINDFEHLKNKPCLILLEDECFRDIGNFLYYYYPEDPSFGREFWLFFKPDLLRAAYKEEGK